MKSKCKRPKMELTLTQPDDWHLNLNNGDFFQAVAPYRAVSRGRIRVVFAAKLFPKDGTTISQDGVADLFGKYLPALEEIVEQNTALLLPRLTIVMDHITTNAVGFAESGEGFLAAIVTAEHLPLNINTLFKEDYSQIITAFQYLKREIHRHAIVSALTSGRETIFPLELIVLPIREKENNVLLVLPAFTIPLLHYPCLQWSLKRRMH